MATLHCSLAGFDADDTAKLESLAGSLQSQLSEDWSFSTAGADDCDLLLCDLDSAPGAAAWRDGARRNRVRAAATGGEAVFGGMTLRKPLRAHGADGLLHILNEAARIGMAPSGSGLTAPESATVGATPPMPPTSAKPGGLRRLFRAILAWLCGPPAPKAAPRTLPTPEAPASPGPLEGLAEPLPPQGRGIPLPVAPVRERASDTRLAAPALAVAGEVAIYQPDRRSPPSAPPVPGRGAITLNAMGCDLLGLLRRSRAASQVIVFRLGEIPAICAAPTTGMCYTLATLQAVFDSPAATLFPAHVTVARNSYYGRAEVLAGATRYAVSVPALPLKDLFWVATLRCGGADEVECYGQGAFSFSAWPDLAGLPHARHHLTWCGLLARRSVTAAALAKATGHNPAEAAIFLAACDELGILRRKELPASLVLASPDSAGSAFKAAAAFGGVLNRLGFARP